MKRILVLTALAAAALLPASAGAQTCNLGYDGYFSCMTPRGTANGYLDPGSSSSGYSGTWRGTDYSGNTYRGTFTGDEGFLRGVTTVTSPLTGRWGEITRDFTTTCFVFCTTR